MSTAFHAAKLDRGRRSDPRRCRLSMGDQQTAPPADGARRWHRTHPVHDRQRREARKAEVSATATVVRAMTANYNRSWSKGIRSFVMSISTPALPGTTIDPLYPDSDGEPLGETQFHIIAIIHIFEALRQFF